MNAIIIDDDKFYVDLLTSYCEIANISVLETFYNPIEAITKISKGLSADILFLDVHMPELNGFELVDSIPKMQTIITTTDKTTAIEAFNKNAIDFLLKPFDLKRFMQALSKAKMKNNIGGTFFVNINKKLVKVSPNSVLRIESDGNYIKIIQKKDEPNLIVNSSLKKISSNLSQETFVQVHRSHIININEIKDIEDSTIVIQQDVIPIGKSYRAELLSRIKLLK